MTNLTKIMEVSTNTTVKLLQATVFPAVLYGCTGKLVNERKIDTVDSKMDEWISD
jgi:hypothetical protein